MKILKVLYEVLAALMLALTAAVALLGLDRISGISAESFKANVRLFIPLAVATAAYPVFWLVQKKTSGKKAFLALYIKAHLMAIASIVTIYIAIVSSGAGIAAPVAVIVCTIFMAVVAAAMWRISVKFRIWE